MACPCCVSPTCVCTDPLPEAGTYVPNLNPVFGAQYTTQLTGRKRIPTSLTLTVSDMRPEDTFWLFFAGGGGCGDISATDFNGSYVLTNGFGCNFVYGVNFVLSGYSASFVVRENFDFAPTIMAELAIPVIGCNTSQYKNILCDWATWIQRMCNREPVEFARASAPRITATLTPSPLP